MLSNDEVTDLCLSFKNLLVDEMNESDTKKFNDGVTSILATIEKLDLSITPYSRFSNIVFSLENTDGLSDVLSRLNERIMQLCLEEGGGVTSKYLYSMKIVENLQLANAQKVFLFSAQQNDIDEIKKKYKSISDDLQSKANEISDGVDKKIKDTKDKYDGMKQNLDETLGKITTDLDSAVDTRINAIYSGFVSVLGIFVAITFSLFGAATLLNNIFNIATRRGFDTSANVIGTNIVLAGFTTILVYLLIVGLFQGIGSITNHYFDFSIRRLFIVMAIAGAIIISGFLYSHSRPNLEHVAVIVGVLGVYMIICLIIYKFGTQIKKRILPKRHKNYWDY